MRSFSWAVYNVRLSWIRALYPAGIEQVSREGEKDALKIAFVAEFLSCCILHCLKWWAFSKERERSTACSPNPASRQRRAWVDVIRSALGRKHSEMRREVAGAGVLQPEQRRAPGGQTPSSRASVLVAMWGLAPQPLSLPEVSPPRSPVFTLGPLAPVIRRAQQRDGGAGMGQSWNQWTSEIEAVVPASHMGLQRVYVCGVWICSVMGSLHGLWLCLMQFSCSCPSPGLCYDVEGLICLLAGSLPATSKVSVLIREAAFAAKASTEVVLDVQCVSAPFLPAAWICLLPWIALPANPLRVWALDCLHQTGFYILLEMCDLRCRYSLSTGLFLSLLF